jgi:hypothetical protein
MAVSPKKTGGDHMPENMSRASSHPKRIFWEHHLEKWQQSGLSQRAYCHAQHLKVHQFYYWRRRILKPEPEVSFMPVALPVEPIRSAQAVRVLMPNGFAVELKGWNEPDQLQQVIAMVAGL